MAHVGAANPATRLLFSKLGMVKPGQAMAVEVEMLKVELRVWKPVWFTAGVALEADRERMVQRDTEVWDLNSSVH